jgi:hypothetical protein
MNRYLTIGLGAAAVVVLGLFLGYQLLGGPGPNTGAPSVEPTPTAQPSTAEPTSTPDAFVPEPLLVTGGAAPVQVTVEVASPGWSVLAGLDGITKDDDGLDPPDSVGAAFLAWGWQAGTEFVVYGDPCAWSTTSSAPATTPDEIAAALAAQASTDATAPVDVTVGGFSGKSITVHVPMSYEVPGATREEEFGACDGDMFAFYGVQGESEPVRNAQGPGQIDELWILDVDGSIVILDAAYSPATPAELVEEMRALAESATFELP